MSEDVAISLERIALDDPAIQGLVERSRVEMRHRYPDEVGPPVPPPEPHEFVPPAGVFLVARIGDRLAGCGGFRTLEPGVAEVKRMYVDPAFRRAGVARAVLTALERDASAAGFRAMRLETGVRQPEAIALYRSAGYRSIPCFGGYEGVTVSVCFEKRLTKEAN